MEFWEMDLQCIRPNDHENAWVFLHIVQLIKCHLKRACALRFIFCCYRIFVAWIMATEHCKRKRNSPQIPAYGMQTQDKWGSVVAEWNVEIKKKKRREDENIKDYIIKTQQWNGKVLTFSFHIRASFSALRNIVVIKKKVWERARAWMPLDNASR